MKRKFLSLALVLSLLIGMMALPASATETKNLLPELDSDFENGTNEGSSVSTGMRYVEDAQNAQSGNWYLSTPETATEGTVFGLSVSASVKGSTTYTVSFWARSGKANSGRILIRNMVNNIPYSQSGHTSVLGTDITAQFGHKPAQGEERSDWYEVKKSFTTAPETTHVLLQIYSEYTSGSGDVDLKLCLDNLSLVEGTENLLRNGEMDVNQGGTAPDYWTPYKATGTGTYEVVEDPAAPGSGNMVYKNGTYYQLYQYVVLPKGQYKLTTRFNGPKDSYAAGGATCGDYISWGGASSFRGAMGSAISDALANTWVTYTTYFTAPVDDTYAVGLGWRWETGGRYYDDVVLLPAEENTVEYVTKETAAVAESMSGNATHVRGNDVRKISDVKASDNVHTLTAVGHYLAKDPTATEKFTLISAVYQKNKTTNKIMLHSVAIEDGESAQTTGYGDTTAVQEHNSENIMADISVPVADDTYTYEVKSFLWSSVNGMQPVSEKFTLTY